MLTLIRQLLCLWLALFGALATAPAGAQSSNMSDIDVFGQGGTGDPPNVLLVMDNTANWSVKNSEGVPRFRGERTALYNTVAGLAVGSVRLGIMMFTESGNGGANGSNTGASGAYVRSSIRLLDQAYKDKLLAMISKLDENNDKGSNGQAALSMMEAYNYFSGGATYGGRGKAKADWAGTRNEPDATVFPELYAIYQTAGNALSSKDAETYNPPPSVSCGGNYVIYISNGAAQDNSGAAGAPYADAKLTAAYEAVGARRPTDNIALNPNGSQGNFADEWARFMNRTAPQQIRSYVVEVDKDTTGQGPGWSALLNSMAANGNGEYSAVSSTNNGVSLEIKLGDIFNRILAANSVFSSASLPVSVNARGSYLNQVFMGMFRPDGDAKPRWRGNLKQYQFSYNVATDSVYLTDSAGDAAINSSTGFINPTAKSVWTTTSTFFASESGVGNENDWPDGDVVEKGGAAQRQRTVYGATDTALASRKVYTCYDCDPRGTAITLSGTDYEFITTNSRITASRLGVTDSEKNQLIEWVRGAHNAGNSAKDFPPNTRVRTSIHGDVLHSRPAVVNYGPDTTNNNANNIVVFYGSNDGTFRAINGNTSAAYQGAAAGDEYWAYIPQEVWNTPSRSVLKRLRSNDPEVRVATTSPVTNQIARDYTMDGPVGLYQKVSSNGTSSKVHVYTGMRRGGRSVYAFDATTITTPKLLWRVTENSSDMSKLGQTWSEPRVVRLKGYKDADGNAIPVILMGGGYDAAAEDRFTPGTTTMGNRVFVLNALTGEVLNNQSVNRDVFDTVRSVPSDIAVVDSDYDGYVDRAYVSDVGGNVYRMDFEVTKADGTIGMTASDWRMWRIANLSDDAARKVFFAPDVVLSGSFTAIMIGTGDREKPLCGGSASAASSCTTTNDAFFTIKDTVGTRPSVNQTFTVITPSSLDVVGTSGATYAAGCKIAMSNGEKVINAPLTVGGYTYFSTNKPTQSANSCTGSLGTAKTYGAKFYCQGAISETRTGGGLPPSPVSGVVAVTYTDPNTNATVNKLVPFLIGGVADPNASTGTADRPANDSGCGLAGCKPVLNITPTRTRKYWNVENPR